MPKENKGHIVFLSKAQIDMLLVLVRSRVEFCKDLDESQLKEYKSELEKLRKIDIELSVAFETCEDVAS